MSEPGKVVAKKGVVVSNQIRLDPTNPIPVQTNGLFYTGSGGKGYIPFLGKYDNFPTVLLEARLLSPTQNGCISRIAGGVVGRGLKVVDNDNPNADFVKWMDNVNNFGDSLADVSRSAIDGERTHGNQFVEVMRAEFGKERTIKVYLHPMQYTRLSEPDALDVPKSVLIDKRFAKKGQVSLQGKQAGREIPLYNPNNADLATNWKDNGNGTSSTMLFIKNDYSGVDYYGLPASIACLGNQQKEYKMTQYDLDNLNNNMNVGGIAAFEGSLTQDEADKAAATVNDTHSGLGNAGRWAMLSSEQQGKWTFMPFTTQKEGSFIEAHKLNQQIIRETNECPVDLSSGGSLGKGGSYLRAEWDKWEAGLLIPLRKKLWSKILQPILAIYAEWMNVKEVAAYKLDFISSMPFSLAADLKPELLLTVDEGRKILGEGPYSDPAIGAKLMVLVGAKQQTTGGENVP